MTADTPYEQAMRDDAEIVRVAVGEVARRDAATGDARRVPPLVKAFEQALEAKEINAKIAAGGACGPSIVEKIASVQAEHTAMFPTSGLPPTREGRKAVLDDYVRAGLIDAATSDALAGGLLAAKVEQVGDVVNFTLAWGEK